MKKRSWTNEQLEVAIKLNKSIRQVLISLNLNPCGGGNYQTIWKLIKNLNIDTSHFTGQGHNKDKSYIKRDISVYLSNEQPIQSHKLRLRLLKEKIFEHKCSSCGLNEWLGNKIPLELDHIDGQHLNNELSNLRLLCPNCHAMTSTYCRKGKGRSLYSIIV